MMVDSRNAALTALTLNLLACVKDDPTITGHRDGGAAASVDARAPKVLLGPQDDGPDEDPADCRRCGETLSTTTARGTLCRKNAPTSSASLLNAVADCICYDKCIDECGTYCAGSTQSGACGVCITTQCGTAVSACLGDVR